MPEERRETQSLNPTEHPWHLCKQGKAAKRPGWFPDLGWEVWISPQTEANFEEPRAGNSHAEICEGFTLHLKRRYEVILLDNFYRTLEH